jgi:PAS domain S-box-containing protein
MKTTGQNPEVFQLDCTNSMGPAIIGNILDSMSDSLLVLGEDGEILYANSISEQVLGFSPEEIKKKGLGDVFFTAEQTQDFKSIFLDALWKKDIKNYREVDYRHPDGTVRRLAVTTSYLLARGEHESSFIGFVALFKDITEIFRLRRIERSLIQKKERIDRERISSLHKLAMGVAHEIRNPVVTIGGFAARIERNTANSDETRQYAKNIVEDALRLETVVNEVQQYCDLSAARPSLGDLSTVVTAVVAEVAPVGRARNISLTVRNGLPAGHRAFFDPSLIRIALVALVKNAFDFSPDGSAVELALEQQEQSTVLEVRDHGSGIQNEDRDYIFNPFFSTQVHASGMGLAIVEQVVHEHMGKIEVESEPGRGTVLRIILPNAMNPEGILPSVQD